MERYCGHCGLLLDPDGGPACPRCGTPVAQEGPTWPLPLRLPAAPGARHLPAGPEPVRWWRSGQSKKLAPGAAYPPADRRGTARPRRRRLLAVLALAALLVGLVTCAVLTPHRFGGFLASRGAASPATTTAPGAHGVAGTAGPRGSPGATSGAATAGAGPGASGATPGASPAATGAGTPPGATATPPPAPSATATPTAVVVTISPTAVTVTCGNATVTVQLSNLSASRAATWSAIAAPLLGSYTLSPAHGTIPPGGQQALVISQIASLGTVVVTSGGLPQEVTIACTVVP